MNLATFEETIDVYNEENIKVAARVRRYTGMHPRTRVTRIDRQFSVDLATGNITVAPVDNSRVLRGYLTHENGHRVVFPVSPAAWMAFTAAVASMTDAPSEIVVAAANIVADAFSDTIMAILGLSHDLASRVPDFIKRIQIDNHIMAFKTLVYKAIELTAKSWSLSVDTLEKAADELKNIVDPSLIDRVKPLAKELLSYTWDIVRVGVKRLVSFLSNPTPGNIIDMQPLTHIAASLIELDQRLGALTSHHGTVRDLNLSVIEPTDVHKALAIAFGFNSRPQLDRLVQAIETIYSVQLKSMVKRLLEKLQLVYVQAGKARRPSGYVKATTELWLKPRGDIDEDSLILENRKLLARVVYKKPIKHGRHSQSPSRPPEKLIIVQDESGSTFSSFGDSNIPVIYVESYISLLVLAGLAHVGGARNVTVIKFSDLVKTTYSGPNTIDAGVKTVLPSSIAGLGTNIVGAVSHALDHADKNTALVVITDAQIDDNTAYTIGSMLRSGAESGKIGFIVFIVVNAEENSAVGIIRKSLHGLPNCIISQIRNADDMKRVGWDIVSLVLQTYHQYH